MLGLDWETTQANSRQDGAAKYNLLAPNVWWVYTTRGREIKSENLETLAKK
jgi:hypothetical protein